MNDFYIDPLTLYFLHILPDIHTFLAGIIVLSFVIFILSIVVLCESTDLKEEVIKKYKAVSVSIFIISVLLNIAIPDTRTLIQLQISNSKKFTSLEQAQDQYNKIIDISSSISDKLRKKKGE